MRRVDGEGASRFGRGRGRPWGRVARAFIGSKVKSSEWRNFGVERLLGAANGDCGNKATESTREKGPMPSSNQPSANRSDRHSFLAQSIVEQKQESEYSA